MKLNTLFKTRSRLASMRRDALRSSSTAAEVLEERIVLASLGLPQDLAAFYQGSWVVGVSNGVSAFQTSTWAAWANLPWDRLVQGDFTGDGRTDVLGLLDGQWWVGRSTGTGFVTTLWAQWANLNWQDVQVADLNADGRQDIFARLGNQYWAALSTGTAFVAPAIWATTGGIQWDSTFLSDVSGDGRADLVVRLDGNWFVGLSTGAQFTGATQWLSWIDAQFDGLTMADMNFDGRADMVGFLNGAWWVGFSTGGLFDLRLVAEWNDVDWRDARLGDFDGNGFGDVAARVAGQWWVGQLSAVGGVVVNTTTRWAVWSDLAWADVRVGDFNGDGRDDIAGRFNGEWWVGRSTGTAFITTKWATWNNLAFQAVATIQANNVPAAAASDLRTEVTRTPVTRLDEERAALFWSQADEDDEFSRVLLASA